MRHVRNIIFLIIIAISGTGCATVLEATTPVDGVIGQPEQIPFPFAIDPSTARAFLSSDSLNVYLSGESDVIYIKFALPDVEMPVLRFKLSSDSRSSIIHYSGPNIAQYVIPVGPAISFPETNDYSQTNAIEGIIVCETPPLKGEFQFGKVVMISLEEVDFGDGLLYKSDPVQLEASTFPP